MKIVTIDGPAGAGKSTAARGLADRLGYEYLDTGAMYRVVGLAVHRAQLSLHDANALAQLLTQLRIKLPKDQVWCNGEDVTTAIRTPEIAQLASQVAVLAPVRQHLAKQQRIIAENRRMVCEGRDQGSVVFPDAFCKFFLRADPEERARRRWLELQRAHSPLTYAQVLQAQYERDERDSGRELAPLVIAPDAIVIDTTAMDTESVLARLEQVVCQRSKDLKKHGTD